ncbi:MAG: hypothetical protein E4H10_15010 [Bacteroidia bacterium]|nr:MAG: hypothetical protein E4H10_15010 [Bacteroidia bacterium]
MLFCCDSSAGGHCLFPPPSGQVKVEGGWIQGTVEDGLTVFKGIPFAAPPVGEFRWKAPQALEKWEGVNWMFTCLAFQQV